MWTADSGPSLFWPSKVCIFFNSTSMLTFNNIVRWHFYTHKIDASNDASASFFCLFLFFSSFSDCYCSIAQWVMSVLSFSSALITAKRFLLSVSSALTILRTLRWTFCKERLARKDTWKLKFEAARFEPSILITFYLWKFFRRYRGLNPGLHSQSCLWCIYCKAALMQTWKLDNSSSRWGV